MVGEKWRIWKIIRGKVTNISELTKFFSDENCPRLFFPDKVLRISLYSVQMRENVGKMRTRITAKITIFTQCSLISGAKIIYKKVWSPVQGLFKFFDDNKKIRFLLNGQEIKKTPWRMYLYEKKLNAFWTMPTSI